MVCDGSTMDRFEVMMAALEDFTMSEEFCDMQDAFCRDKCHVFKDSEENNLEYMAVFNAWVQTLEVSNRPSQPPIHRH